jgi:hypothetical protein
MLKNPEFQQNCKPMPHIQIPWIVCGTYKGNPNLLPRWLEICKRLWNDSNGGRQRVRSMRLEAWSIQNNDAPYHELAMTFRVCFQWFSVSGKLFFHLACSMSSICLWWVNLSLIYGKFPASLMMLSVCYSCLLIFLVRIIKASKVVYKYPQFLIRVLVQIKNGDKSFWK